MTVDHLAKTQYRSGNISITNSENGSRRHFDYGGIRNQWPRKFKVYNSGRI